MNIPNKVRVEGINFKVYQLSAEEINSLKSKNQEGDVCGFTSFEDAKILINDSYCQEMKEQTFMHELIHVCDSRMNPLTEDQIDNLARRLYGIIKDNPKLFKD